ncbi:hypothetical protein [Dryocola clanedunensis]|uniref:hypothetical protein n=1 Tax=Cedecea sulfonylureivorans TaxID=3051154 RepID=UPI001927FDBF|nr:hypothetical protein [Cedecea sulfonylureivorans]
MADATFILPKGIYGKYKAIIPLLKMDIAVSQDDPSVDIHEMSCVKGGDVKDFLDLVEAMRLFICRAEGLTTEAGGAGKVWIFHK